MRKIANVKEYRQWSHSINGRVFDIQMKIIKLQLLVPCCFGSGSDSLKFGIFILLYFNAHRHILINLSQCLIDFCHSSIIANIALTSASRHSSFVWVCVIFISILLRSPLLVLTVFAIVHDSRWSLQLCHQCMLS